MVNHIEEITILMLIPGLDMLRLFVSRLVKIKVLFGR